MNKAEYRIAINDALENRKVGKPGIKDMLEQKGINKGNFYAFLRGTDKAMSLKNLQIIYKEMVASGMFPTNRAWFESLDNKEMAKFIKTEFARNDPDIKPKDIENWLGKTKNPEQNKKDDQISKIMGKQCLKRREEE